MTTDQGWVGGEVDTLTLNLSALQQFSNALICLDTWASLVSVDLQMPTRPAKTLLGQYRGETRTEGKIVRHGCMASCPLPCSLSYVLLVPSFPLAI